MEFDAADLSFRQAYKLMIGSIVPRPIAWVSTIGATGQYNLAPYSFFTGVCSNPPTLVFCPNIRSLDGQAKDTLNNIRYTGEFVVNIVTEDQAEAMNTTSTETPADVDEFALAGLSPLPSKLVSAPRVGESPINLECKLSQIVTIGEEIGQGSLVIGEIVYFHVDDSVYIPDHKIDPTRTKHVGRMGGTFYTRTQDLFDLIRPTPQINREP